MAGFRRFRGYPGGRRPGNRRGTGYEGERDRGCGGRDAGGAGRDRPVHAPGLDTGMVEEEIPETVDEMIDRLQTSPVAGSFRGKIGDIGDVELQWGLGLGSLMMLAGGLLQILGGLLSVEKSPRQRDGI